MDKYIYDDKNGLWYELQGDYYIPCLILPTEKEQPIGLWGQRQRLKPFTLEQSSSSFLPGRPEWISRSRNKSVGGLASCFGVKTAR